MGISHYAEGEARAVAAVAKLLREVDDLIRRDDEDGYSHVEEIGYFDEDGDLIIEKTDELAERLVEMVVKELP